MSPSAPAADAASKPLPAEEALLIAEQGLHDTRPRVWRRFLLSLAASAAGIGGFSYLLAHEASQAHSGTKVEATVVRFSPYGGLLSPASIVVEYPVGSTEEEVRIATASNVSFQVGQQVQVSYAPSHPTQAVLTDTGNGDPGALAWLFFGLAIAGLLFLPSGSSQLRTWFAARRVLRHPDEPLLLPVKLAGVRPNWFLRPNFLNRGSGLRDQQALLIAMPAGGYLGLWAWDRAVRRVSLDHPDVPMWVFGDVGTRHPVAVVDPLRQTADFGRIWPMVWQRYRCKRLTHG